MTAQFIRGLIIFLSLTWHLPALAETMSLEQVLEQLYSKHPSLHAAERQLQRAQQESIRVESQLGWVLSGQAGAGRDISLIGEPTDRLDAGLGLKRSLSSGGRVDLKAGYVREDSEQAFSPLLPNPSTSQQLDLSYRQPWGQGADNPNYHQGLVEARVSAILAEADRRGRYDQLTRQALNLYYDAATTQARLDNAQRAVDRSERLKKYIQANIRLGLAEEKDLLQVDAQHKARLAELRSLEVFWGQQRTGLNRLMMRAWDAPLKPWVEKDFPPLSDDKNALLAQAQEYSSSLQREQARLQQVEAIIARSHDSQRDKLDLVYSIGNRNRSGDSALGSVDDSEVVGGLRLEYERLLDKRGVDAGLYQAQLQRSIILDDIKSANEDLRYNVFSLMEEIKAVESALATYQASLESEKAKLAEAEKRYRRGRTDTDRLIQFESELSFAELSVALQTVELARRRSLFNLLRGLLTNKSINPPPRHISGDAMPSLPLGDSP